MTYKISITCNGIEPLIYQWEAFDESSDQRDYYRNQISSGVEQSERDANIAAVAALERHVAYRNKIVNKTYVWKP